MQRTLPTTLTTDTTVKLQGVKTWVHISQLKKILPHIWFCANAGVLKLCFTWTGNNEQQDRWLPSLPSDQEYLFPFLLPSLTIPSQIPIIKIFRILPSTFYLLLSEKIISLFLQVRSFQRGLIQPPNIFQICHQAADPIVLPITKSSSFRMPQFLWNYHSPLSYQSP